MALLKFLKGNYSNLSNAAINEGQVLICGDTGEMFVDVAADKRVKIGDFVVVSDIQALEALDASAVPTSRLYYVENGNILARSNGATWTQINKQPTTAELKLALGLNADGEVTKAIAAAKKAGDDAQVDVDNLEKYVGTFTHDTAKTVVEYINAKTDGIATSGNLEALGQRVTTAEGEIDDLQAAIGDGGSVTLAIADAKKAGTDAQATADGVVKDLGDHEADTVAHITAEERTAWNGKTTMAEVEAKGYLVADDISGKADKTQVAKDIEDAVKVETDNRVLADQAIEAKIGTVAEGKTVVKMIEEAQAAATYDDEEVRGLISDNAADIKAIADDYLKGADKTELQGNIDTVSGKVTTLIGEDANKSVRTIANEELAKQLIAEGAQESLDTLAEIAAWIQSHPDDASAMNEAIVALQKQLHGIGAGEGTVKKYVDDAIAALNVGQYALAADLTALAGRVETLETESAKHAAKTEVEAVSTALNEYKEAHKDDYTNAQIDAAIKVVADDLSAYEEAHASDYTNEQINNAIANAGHASAADLATHTGNADIHVTTADKEKWNAAEQNAKDYSDGKLATAKTELEGKISAAETAAKGHADTEVGKVQSALDTYKESNNAAVAGKADKATTLAGYGITDAMTKTDIEAMLTWSEF